MINASCFQYLLTRQNNVGAINCENTFLPLLKHHYDTAYMCLYISCIFPAPNLDAIKLLAIK